MKKLDFLKAEYPTVESLMETTSDVADDMSIPDGNDYLDEVFEK